jgi:hypothetical protein
MSFKKDEAIDPIYSTRGSKTTIYEDWETGKRRIVTVKDLKARNDLCFAKQRIAGEKTSRFFNENERDGIRLIAKIDPLELAAHTEWVEDPKSFEKWLDEHPEAKVLPVGWTRQQQRRGAHNQIISDNLEKIFKNG